MLWTILVAIGCDDPLRWQTRILLQQEVELTVPFAANEVVRPLTVSVSLADGVYDSAWEPRFGGYAFEPELGDLTVSCFQNGELLTGRRFDEDGLIVLDGCRELQACQEQFELQLRRPMGTDGARPLEALAFFDVTIREQSALPPRELEANVLTLTVDSTVAEEPHEP